MNRKHISTNLATAKHTRSSLLQKHRFCTVALVIMTSAVMLFGCRHHNDSKKPVPVTVTVTVKGDAHVTVNPKALSVEKGSKWAAIKGKISVRYAEGFDALSWKIGTASGADIKDDAIFNEDTTVFAVSKNINERKYTVRHLQQNVSGNDYTLVKEASQAGIKGAPTSAVAETYQGFTALPVTQVPIADDNTTVVEIKYNRNIITLEFNLDHGSTTTSLEEGKFLKGRFDAPVSIAEPKKVGYKFDKWEPELPKKFPSQSPSTVYTAKWKQLRITIQGDERIAATALGTTLSVAYNATWADVEAAATEKAVLKTEWGTDDYEIYQWRLTDANGKRLETTHVFTDDATVYAVTNYKSFNINGSILDAYPNGKAPRGSIIIPPNITIIDSNAFAGASELTNIILPQELREIRENAFASCTKLTAITIPEKVTKIDNLTFSHCTSLSKLTVDPKNKDFSSEGDILYTKNKTKLLRAAFTLKEVHTIPDTVTEIGPSAFEECSQLASIILPIRLTAIKDNAFHRCSNLKEVKLPNKLEEIGQEVFLNCTSAVITLDKKITKIEPGSFGYDAASFCKEVRIPNGATFDHIVTKVKNAGYPEERIKRY